MTMITIDGTEYDVDKLSQEAQGQIVSLQFVDAELQRLNAQAAALQTARSTYARVLAEILEKDGDAAIIDPKAK